MGGGCGTVGKAVVSETRDPRVDYSQRELLILISQFKIQTKTN